MMSLLDRQDGDTIDIDFEDLYCGLYDQGVHQDGLYDQDGLSEVHQDGLGDDFLQNNWGNSVIEDSLETIRNVLATANIPADNRKVWMEFFLFINTTSGRYQNKQATNT